MCLISCDNSFRSWEDKYTNSISWLLDIRRTNINTLSWTRNTSERRNILCLTNILKSNRKCMSLFGKRKADNMSILLENSENFCFKFWIWCLDSRKTSKVAISDASEEICDRIDDHKKRKNGSKNYSFGLLPAWLSNAHKFSGICFLTDTDSTEIKFSNISIRTSTVWTTMIESSGKFWILAIFMSTRCCILSISAFIDESCSSHRKKFRF